MSASSGLVLLVSSRSILLSQLMRVAVGRPEQGPTSHPAGFIIHWTKPWIGPPKAKSPDAPGNLPTAQQATEGGGDTPRLLAHRQNTRSSQETMAMLGEQSPVSAANVELGRHQQGGGPKKAKALSWNPPPEIVACSLNRMAGQICWPFLLPTSFKKSWQMST